MKILVASSTTASDEHSADPVAAVAVFPWPENSEFRVLSVAGRVEPVMAGMLPAIPDIPDVSAAQQSVDAAATSAATSAAERLRQSGFHAEGVAMEGDPEEEITDYARNWGADVIVVGSRERSLVERLLMGSVSQGVVKHSPCSVLVVKQCRAA